MKEIILLGMGGHAHSVVDSIEKGKQYHIAGFLEPDVSNGASYKGYKVLGNDEILVNLYKKGMRHAFVTVGYMGTGKVRVHLYQKLKQIGYQIPNIVDPSAEIANNVQLGDGNFVGKNAVINAGTVVGNMCIINTSAIIEHDCYIDHHVHLAVGSVICGNAQIGEETFVGANSVIIQGISVGQNVLIGAGTVVTKDISDHMLQYGSALKYRGTMERTS